MHLYWEVNLILLTSPVNVNSLIFKCISLTKNTSTHKLLSSPINVRNIFHTTLIFPCTEIHNHDRKFCHQISFAITVCFLLKKGKVFPYSSSSLGLCFSYMYFEEITISVIKQVHNKIWNQLHKCTVPNYNKFTNSALFNMITTQHQIQ